MLVGYARTSTVDQEASLEAQLREPKGSNAKRSSKSKPVRWESARLLKSLPFTREGDTLVVTKLDRLARSVSHLGEILERLGQKKVALRILDLGIDTSSATGELVLNVMGAIRSSSER